MNKEDVNFEELARMTEDATVRAGRLCVLRRKVGTS